MLPSKKYGDLRYNFHQPSSVFPVSKHCHNAIPTTPNRTLMKKLSILVILCVATATAVFSQALRKTEKINADQVPVAILESFQNDFGKIPDNGYWTANIEIERDGARSVVKPLSYTFHKKSKDEKVEVRYSPDGKLEFVKGLEKVTS
jgi:hypothetical protein